MASTGPILLHPSRDRPRWRSALASHLPGASVVGPSDDLSAVRYALTWAPPPGLFTVAPRLEVVFALGAGVNHLTGLVPPTVSLVRLTDAGMAAQMVEYHLYAVLHYFRGFDRYASQQRAADWSPLPPPSPAEFRIGVLGDGVLGSRVSSALGALGFSVSRWARTPRPGVRHGEDGLHALLADADALIVLLPQTPQTTHLLSAERLSRLPPGAALINAARSGIVDTDALLDALDSGHLRGAFLDVAPAEPLPEGHRLWTHPRVVLTPHVAAATLPEPSIAQVVDNIHRHQRGEPMLGMVSPAVGY